MGLGSSTRHKKKEFSITQIAEQRPSLCFDDFQILRAIGKGSFGKVCIVQKKDNMKMYAMKYMNKNQCVENDAFKNVLREIEILSSLDHPFLVNLWFTFQDEEDMFMVVDLLLGGDLRYYLLQGNFNFNEDSIKLYLCEIGLALDYLRSKKILHRDIKPDNIILNDAGHAHITDFNIATLVKDDEVVTSVSGTKPYMAPEVVVCAWDHTDGYSFSADWWSLGVTAYEMFCRKRPYDIHSGSSVEQIHEMIMNTCLRFPKSINRKAATFVQQLLSTDPYCRISSVEQMKMHSFLKDVNFDDMYAGNVAPSFIPNVTEDNTLSKCSDTTMSSVIDLTIPDDYDDDAMPLEVTDEYHDLGNFLMFGANMINERIIVHICQYVEKNQLNCDPTFELEEMIIEAKPLHKKKKRLSKRNRTRSSLDCETNAAMQKSLGSIQEQFIIYNRESELQRREMAEKEKTWEEELRKVTD